MRHHVDRVAVAFICYGILNMAVALLVGVIITGFAGGLFAVGLDGQDQALVMVSGFYGVVGLAVAAFAVLFAAPNVLVGAAIRRRQRWGWVGGLICAALALSNMPFGTLIGVYAFVTLLDRQVSEDFQSGG